MTSFLNSAYGSDGEERRGRKLVVPFLLFLLFLPALDIPGGTPPPTVKNITTQDLFLAQKNGRNLTISGIGASKSMSPTFDYGHTLILQYPILSPEELNVGDIIIYEKGSNNPVVHRMVEIGEDGEGWYCVTKGDNNMFTDRKVRFQQIKYLVVGVLY
jgi:signal peptidase I